MATILLPKLIRGEETIITLQKVMNPDNIQVDSMGKLTIQINPNSPIAQTYISNLQPSNQQVFDAVSQGVSMVFDSAKKDPVFMGSLLGITPNTTVVLPQTVVYTYNSWSRDSIKIVKENDSLKQRMISYSMFTGPFLRIIPTKIIDSSGNVRDTLNYAYDGKINISPTSKRASTFGMKSPYITLTSLDTNFTFNGLTTLTKRLPDTKPGLRIQAAAAQNFVTGNTNVGFGARFDLFGRMSIYGGAYYGLKTHEVTPVLTGTFDIWQAN